MLAAFEPDLMFFLIVCSILAEVVSILGGLVVASFGYPRPVAPTVEGEQEGASSQFAWERLFKTKGRLIFLYLPMGLVMAATCLSAGIVAYQAHSLRTDLRTASTMRIRTVGYSAFPDEILYETSDLAVIKDCLDQIDFKLILPFARCRCLGEMTFEFYREGQLVKTFNFLHGSGIRIPGQAFGDWILTKRSRRDIASWLEDRGVPDKLDAWYERWRQARQAAETQAASEVKP